MKSQKFGLGLLALLISISISLMLWANEARAAGNCDNEILTGLPQAECQALVDLYNTTDGLNWKSNDGWLVADSPCNWYGVTCSQGHVSELSLGNNQLFGQMLDTIGDLTFLTTFNFNQNGLIEEIPSTITNLSALQDLDLGCNMLTSTDLDVINFLNSHDPDVLQNQCFPEIHVNFTGWIRAFNFNADPSVTIRIFDQQDGNVLYESVKPIKWRGYPTFRAFQHRLKPRSGYYIEVQGNRTNIKQTMTIQPFTLIKADYHLGEYLGTSLPNTEVILEGQFGKFTGQSDQSGIWRFSSVPSLEDWESIEIYISDAQGNKSGIWNFPMLVEVGIPYGWLYIDTFIPESQITLQIYDQPGGTELYHNNQIYVNWQGRVMLDSDQLGIKLQPGMNIKIYDHATSRDLDYVIQLLTLDQLDYEGFRYSGTANPNTEIEVIASDKFDFPGDIYESSDDNGFWSADLSGQELDASKFYWRVGYIFSWTDIGQGYTTAEVYPANRITANLTDDSIIFDRFLPDGPVTITVYDAMHTNILYEQSIDTVTDDEFLIGKNIHKLDLLPGMEIETTDQYHQTIKFLNLAEISISGIDQNSDRVWGTATPGSSVFIDVLGVEDVYYNYVVGQLWVISDDNGQWEANFGLAGYDITTGNKVIAKTMDIEGDITSATSSNSSPYCADVVEISKSECEALVAFYQSTGGVEWFNNEGWLNTNTPCSWYGVSCEYNSSTGFKEITKLNFFYNNMFGTLPAEIGDLVHITELDVFENYLEGEIPFEITLLKKLNRLSLDSNYLTTTNPVVLNFLYRWYPSGLPSQASPRLEIDPVNDSIFINYFKDDDYVGIDIYNPVGDELLYTGTRSLSYERAYLGYNKHYIDFKVGTYIVVTGYPSGVRKEVIIPPLSIDSVDYTSGIITGTVPPGTTHMNMSAGDYGENSQPNLVIGPDGVWVADFSGTPLSQDWNIYAEVDINGNLVGVSLKHPRIEVGISSSDVSLYNFPPNTPARIEIYDHSGGELRFTSESILTNSRGQADVAKPQTGEVLLPGMYVKIVDLMSGRAADVNIPLLSLDSVDYETMLISGQSEPNAELEVGADLIGSWAYMIIQNDMTEAWTADISDLDINPLKYFGPYVAQYDDDGDDTFAALTYPEYIFGDLDDDTIEFVGFRHDRELLVSVYSETGNSTLWSSNVIMDEEGAAKLGFAVHGLDLKSGYKIEAEDILTGKIDTLILTNVKIDQVDIENGLVFGSADSGSTVVVNAGNIEQKLPYRVIRINVAGTGEWKANFEAAGIPLTQDSVIRAFERDVDGDQTISSAPVDSDGDGYDNQADNAPHAYNPDQRDLDSDGLADVIDPCPADLNNACNQQNSAAVSIGAAGGTLTTPNSNTTITIPAYALAEDTSISATDMGTGFIVQTDQGEGTAVIGVEMGPPGIIFVTPATLTLSWLDDDNDGVVDGTAILESTLFVSQDEVAITAVCSLDPDCDMDGNTFTFAVNGFSQFALVALNNQPPIAVAGGAYTALEGNSVTLDASASHDPDGDSLTYAWDLDGDGAFDDAVGVTTSVSFNDNGTYSIGLKVTDPSGAGATDYVQVVVTNVDPTVNTIQLPLDPMQVGSSIVANATFVDPGAHDTHTATWTWGDGTISQGNVNGRSVSGTHVYSNLGVYTVNLSVFDDDGGLGTAMFQYVVIYDPSAGFVTGGGWFISPTGACQYQGCTDSTTGKAMFGFEAKYKKGELVPTGKVEFQLQKVNFVFRSSSYQWLIISGNKAILRGVGSVNGQINYGFIVSGIDGTIAPATGIDRIRIKIWDLNSGLIGYDNQMGATDYADPTTANGGGNIKIHKAH